MVLVLTAAGLPLALGQSRSEQVRDADQVESGGGGTAVLEIEKK